MRKMTLILLLLTMAITACSLNNAAEPTDDVEDTITVIDAPINDDTGSQPDPVETTEPAPDPAEPTAIADAGSGGSGGSSNNGDGNQPEASCQIRTDWPHSYGVVAGDTLTKIATRANTTASTIAVGNCLSNPNAISVGQVLYVPNPVAIPTDEVTVPVEPDLPIGGDPLETLCNDPSRQSGDYPMMLPVLNYSNGCVEVAARDTLTITWPGVPPEALEVVYLLRYPNTMQVIELGRSSDAANQFAITKPVTELGGAGLLTARVEGAATLFESDVLGFRTIQTPVTACGDLPTETLGGAGSPVITPATHIGNGCYRVTAGTTVTVSMPVVPPEAVEVTFYRNNTRLSRPDVIGVDSDLSDGASITWFVHANMPPSTIYLFPLPGDFGGVIGVVVE